MDRTGTFAAVELLHADAVQAANGCFAALLFNLLYDALLSRSVEWHTMCPMIDLMNHRTGIKASSACISPPHPSVLSARAYTAAGCLR